MVRSRISSGARRAHLFAALSSVMIVTLGACQKSPEAVAAARAAEQKAADDATYGTTYNQCILKVTNNNADAASACLKHFEKDGDSTSLSIKARMNYGIFSGGDGVIITASGYPEGHVIVTKYVVSVKLFTRGTSRTDSNVVGTTKWTFYEAVRPTDSIVHKVTPEQASAQSGVPISSQSISDYDFYVELSDVREVPLG